MPEVPTSPSVAMSNPILTENSKSFSVKSDWAHWSVLYGASGLFALICAVFLISIIVSSIPAWHHSGLSIIYGRVWSQGSNSFGALPIIAGTLATTAIALFFAIPIGIGSALAIVHVVPGSGTTQGWANATTFQQFEAVRSNTSEFAELSVPVTGPKQNIPGAHSINVDAAVRYDDYSGNVGSTTDPEVNISWAPVDDQFKFRASAGKSFIAPALYSLYGPVSSGSTDSITYTTASGGTKSAQFNQTGGANPLLKPTTAKSWSAGFVYTPKVVSGLTVTVDYSRINQKEIPGTVPADTIIQDVELKGTASPYIGDVHYNTPTGPTPSGPGGISGKSPQQIYVIANLINLGGQKINSTDINIDYVKKVAGVGTFDLTSVWTWYNNYQLELIPTQAFYEYSGTASKNEGTIPKWRTYTTLDWKYSGLEAFVGVTWIDSVNDWAVGGAGATVTGTIPSFNSIDLGASYDFAHLHLHKTLDGLKVKVGVNNVQDKQPPIAIDVFPNTNADVGTYNGAIGRMYYVEASYSF